MRSESAIMTDVRSIADVYPAGSGHFVYTSDMHGDGYVDYRPLGADKHQALLREVCVLLLKKAIDWAGFDTREKITVCGPETMGTKMTAAIEAADQCGELPTRLTVCTRKLLKDPNKEGSFLWNVDASQIMSGKQNIWMDDLLNLGTTARTSIQMYRKIGANINTIATIGSRCNVTAEQLGVRYIVSLEEYPGFTIHDPSACNLCMTSVPIVLRPGHGHNFQAKHASYPGGFIESPE